MTEPEITERLQLYLTAERRILEGAQSYSVGQHQFERANLGQIRAEIASLQQQLALAQAVTSGSGPMTARPVVFGGR